MTSPRTAPDATDDVVKTDPLAGDATTEPGHAGADVTAGDTDATGTGSGSHGELDAALLAGPVGEPGSAEPEPGDAANQATTDALLGAIPRARLGIPGPAAPSPSGTHAAWYQPNDEGAWELVLASLEGGPTEIVELPVTLKPTLGPDGDTSSATGPAWSPDGEMIALTCVDPDTGRDAIWLLEVGGGVLRPLVVHDADDRSPRWSANSQVVAFTSRVDGRDRVAIAESRPPEGVSPYAIYLTDGAQDDRDPAWLRTGTEIVFRRRQADPDTDHLWIVSIVDGSMRQATGREGRVGLGSQPAYRHAPAASPDKPQVAYATNEKDWALIAIANTDNGTGWTLAGEAGDKSDPQWSPDGKRVAYVRTIGVVTSVCTKGTAAAVTDVQDPGHGVALHPRWLADGRLLYWYMDSVRSPRLILQQPGPKQPRTVIDPFAPAAEAATSDGAGVSADGVAPAPGQPVPDPVVGEGDAQPTDPATAAPEPAAADATTAAAAPATDGADTSAQGAAKADDAATPAATPAVEEVTAEQVRAGIEPIDPSLHPPVVFEVQTAERLKLPGLLYQRIGEPTATDLIVVSVGDGPPSRAEQRPDLFAQTLLRHGFPLYRANLRGTPGLGKNVTEALVDLADFEAEADDIATIVRSLRENEMGLPARQVLLGTGYGGALALTAAGGRPGTAAAVVAIDPVTDWAQRFDLMGARERRWFQRVFGLPLTDAGRYALRTPSTFAGVIDVPVLLVTRSEESAAALAPLTDVLQEMQVAYEHTRVDAAASDVELARVVAAFLAGVARG